MDLIALSRLGGRHLVIPASAARHPRCHPQRRAPLHQPLHRQQDPQPVARTAGDQLLYRQGNQLLLTPFAERFGPTLRCLQEPAGLTSQEGFALPTGRGLNLAMRESSMIWPMGAVLGQLMQEVPGLMPVVRNKDEQGLAALAAGKLDFDPAPRSEPARGQSSPASSGETCGRTSWSA